MENPRPEKVAVVEEVRSKLDASSAAILTEYRGLKVKDLADLRRTLRAAGGEYKIYKNTLVRFAARDLGLDDLEAMLEGPTAIAFVEGDAVDVAKALRDFARTNPNLVVKGGVLGNSILSAKDAGALADLPSREVLLARIAGGLAAPMVQFAGLLQALPRNFAYGLKALIEKGGAPGAPVDAPAESAVEAPAEAPAEPEAAAPAEPAEAPAEAPAAEAPAAEAPAAEASAAEAPAAEASAAEASAAEASAAEASAAEASAAEAPPAEASAAEAPPAADNAPAEPEAAAPAEPEAAAPAEPAEEAPADAPAEASAPSEESGAGDATAGSDVATAVVEGDAEPTTDEATQPQAAVAEEPTQTETEQEQE